MRVLWSLEATEPDRKLYVAVSEKAYTEFFAQETIQFVVSKHGLPLIVVDLEHEEIVKWTS